MAGLIVHEWLEQRGGSENVVAAMAGAFPDAAIHCLWNNDPMRFPSSRVRESWLAGTPLRRSKAGALPFMPFTWTHLPFPHPDWALISSHVFAHHAAANPRLVACDTYVYVHSPARFLWAPELDPRGRGLVPGMSAGVLRTLDRRKAQAATHLAANSEFVRARIARAWDRDAAVIHPPVAVERILSRPDWTTGLDEKELHTLAALPAPFLLGVSRMIGYKRLDSVIDAGESTGLPVVLAGAGPHLPKLRARAADATVPVHIVVQPSNAALFGLYSLALALVFPAIEDFGIIPVEAMAAGTPVVAAAYGGVLESVEAGATGAFCDFASRASIREAVALAASLSAGACRERARAFSEDVFLANLKTWMRP